MHDRLACAVVVTVVAIWVAVARGPVGAQAPAEAAYLGQPSPGTKAMLFAPGTVSTGLFERDLTVTPDGREIFWRVSSPASRYSTIVRVRARPEGWTSPEVLPYMDDAAAMHIEPALSPDGRRLFFVSTRAAPAQGRGPGNADIWLMERQGDGWHEPVNIGAPVNSEGNEYFPSLTRAGTLYFTRETKGGDEGIYRSRLVGGRYAEPERLPDQVNGGTARFNACVDPDERFLIVPMQGRDDSLGGIDYYVVFRGDDDTWSEPINLGHEINTAGSGEYSPYVTADGRYLFFMSSRGPAAAEASPRLTYRFFQDLQGRPQNGNGDIYWIETSVIEQLRPRGAAAQGAPVERLR